MSITGLENFAENSFLKHLNQWTVELLNITSIEVTEDTSAYFHLHILQITKQIYILKVIFAKIQLKENKVSSFSSFFL